MPDTLIILFTFIIALAIGAYIGKILFSAKAATDRKVLEERAAGQQLQLEQMKQQAVNDRLSFEKQLNQVQAERESLRDAKEAMAVQLSKKETDFDNLMERMREQQREATDLREKFTKEFENLANKIMEEKSAKFTEQNRENLKTILSPLQEKIHLFEKKVEDTHKESIDYHAALRQQILGLREMNEQMSRETLNLTKALKGDTKMQGNWGELVLERVLEKSGLEKGREYYVQQSHITDEGARILPDVVINLPDGKKMIVDSKVSLVAYERFVNEEDETLRSLHLREHCNSIRRHVDQLSEKNYHDLYRIESPDFVLTKVGNKMKDAQAEYQNAMGKLVDGRGNIIVSIEKLKKMGAKAKKALPEAILNRAKAQEEDEVTENSDNLLNL